MPDVEGQPLLPDNEPSPGLIGWLKDAARRLKREIVTLYIASSDSRISLAARISATVVIAYALSPWDLIPDFIPVLGILDDLILLPLGLWITIQLIPENVMSDAREAALERERGGGGRLPVNWVAGTIVALLWIVAIAWLLNLAWHIYLHAKQAS